MVDLELWKSASGAAKAKAGREIRQRYGDYGIRDAAGLQNYWTGCRSCTS